MNILKFKKSDTKMDKNNEKSYALQIIKLALNNELRPFYFDRHRYDVGYFSWDVK